MVGIKLKINSFIEKPMRYEKFEEMVFDTKLSDKLYERFYPLLKQIVDAIPDRKERIKIIDKHQCIMVVGFDEIVFKKNYL